MTTPTETAIPETLNRSQAHRKLLALGMPLKVVTHVLDHPDELLHLFSPMATVVPSKEAVAIVAAYQRHVDSKETTDALEGLPADERERIETAGRTAWDTAYYALPGADAYTCRQAADEARRATVAREAAAYRARQPVNSIGTCSVCGYHGPGPGHDCRPHEPGHRVAVYPDCCLRHRTNGPKGGSCGTLAYEGPDATPETLTRAEAEERLSDAGIRLNTIDDMLSSSQKWLDGMHGLVGPKTRAILRAYVRWLNAHEGIVERAIRLDREATARACGPDLTPAEEAEISASAPGQTPIARAPSTIADAFEAMLAFFICLIGPRPHRKITPAEEIGALAACEVETDFTPDSPPTDLTRLRDLIQRAAEEYAQIRAEASKRLDRGDASRRERKAADLAAGPVTEEELAEIEARTSGPGPLAGDGELLRRCAAEIRRLTAKLAGIEGIAAQGDGMMLTISEQGAEIERLTAELAEVRSNYQARETEWREGRVVLDPSERAPADASLEARAALRRMTIILPHLQAAALDASKAIPGGRVLLAIIAKAADGSGRITCDFESTEFLADLEAIARAADASRPVPGLTWSTAIQIAMALAPDGDVTEQARAVQRIAGEQRGLTEEEARATAGPLSRDIYNRIGLATGNKIGAPEWMRDAIAASLLRASRGEPTEVRGDKPGHVAIPRAVLSRLVDATQRNHDVREAREAAEHVLHLDALRYEPARHDAKAARAAAKRGAK